MTTTPRWAAPLLLAVLTFAAYSPVLRNGFVWDDDMHITRSALNTRPGGYARIWASADAMQYYPLTFSAFRLEHALWGFDPVYYHLLSVLLQAANAVGLGYLLSRLRVPGAWWAAALFAVHPVNAETVAWATELKNLLCLLFALAATDRWLSYEESGRPRDYALALAAYAASLLSKTAAALLPAVFLVLAWARGRKIGRRSFVALSPFLVLGGLMGVVTVLYERYRNGADPAFLLPWLDRPVLAGQVFWFYLDKLARPVGLSFIYRRWTLDATAPRQWLPLSAAVAAAAAAWRARPRLGRAPAAALAAYALLLFPVLGFFPVFFMRFSFVADHFVYFAAVPALALVPAAVGRLLPAPGARRAVLAAAVLACASATYARVPAFRDSEALWRDTLAKTPGAWMAWDNLALEELGQGRWEEAASHAERATALLPGFGVAWFHQGLARWNSGDHAAAAAAFERSLRLDPRYAAAAGPRVALAQTYLGLRELELGRPREAVERMRAAADAAPERAASWFNLARALDQSGRRAEARIPCARGLALAPDSPDAGPCRAGGARR